MKTTKLIVGIFLITLVFTQNTNAQITVGGGLAYGSQTSTVGVNVTGQFYITENIAVAPAFTYYFPSATGIFLGYKRKWYEVNVDANYYPKLTILDGKLKPYGLSGVNYSIISFPSYIYDFFGNPIDNNSYTASRFGVNIGAGADFDIGKKITPFAQLKYTIGFNSLSQAQILAGIRFEF